jgi:hypothetical protein
MPSIYEFEIDSYRKQIQQLRYELKNVEWDEIENKTHFALARSNRANFIIVGLCGLVEVQLFEIAKEQNEFDISEVKDGGLSKLETHLKDISDINFGKLENWDWFKSIYEIRNTIVHSYGGLITKQDPNGIKNHLSKLSLSKYLVGERRIRFEPDGLDKILKVIENLLSELKEYAT